LVKDQFSITNGFGPRVLTNATPNISRTVPKNPYFI